MSLVTRYRTALASPGIPGGAGGPFLPLGGGVMAGDIDLNGNAVTLDAAGTSRLYSLSAGRWNLDAAGVNTLFSDQWRIFPQVEVEMDTQDLDFGGGSNMRMRWDTAETVPLMKIGVLRPLYIGPFGDVGQNRAAGSAPNSGILWRANDTTFANHISSRHEGGNAYFNKGDAGGEFRWQIGGVSYIALDSTGPRIQVKQDMRFDVGVGLDFVGAADVTSAASNATLNAAAGFNANLSVGGAPFLVASGGSNELQCNRQLDLNGNTFKANTSSDVILPRVHDAAAEPTLTDGEMRFWWDTVNSDMYLIIRRSGTQYKIELT